MDNKIKKYAQKIQNQYSSHEKTKYDELKELDKKVKNPVRIFAYIFGSIGSLILGTGMCLAMKVIGGTDLLMIVGIIIGLIGIAIVSTNFFIYKNLIDKRKKQFSNEILELSNLLLNETKIEQN